MEIGNYRILTNGKEFKIQRRGFFWGWNNLRAIAQGGGEYVPTYDTVEDAKEEIEYLIDVDERRKAPEPKWRPVAEPTPYQGTIRYLKGEDGDIRKPLPDHLSSKHVKPDPNPEPPVPPRNRKVTAEEIKKSHEIVRASSSVGQVQNIQRHNLIYSRHYTRRKIREGSYIYRKNKYWVENGGQTLKFKDPTTRKWIDAIIYTPDGKWGEHYVREIEDFKLKFSYYGPKKEVEL